MRSMRTLTGHFTDPETGRLPSTRGASSHYRPQRQTPRYDRAAIQSFTRRSRIDKGWDPDAISRS